MNTPAGQSSFRSPLGFWTIGFLTLTLSWPQAATAQSVHGQLRDPDTGFPIPGALVRLVTDEGREVVGYLSTNEGQFLLRAPIPGRYRVKADRIGYTPTWSAEVMVQASAMVLVDLEMRPEPVALSELEVVADQVCRIRPEDGLGVSRVWEEVRKALTIQAWTGSERLHRFRIAHVESQLDPDGDVVATEVSEETGFFDQVPFRSLPVEVLQRDGYVQDQNPLKTDYYAPDASVLLSDRFLETHCLRLTTDEHAEGRIGVAFEPMRTDRAVDIEGVLWVDRESAELRQLEFRYTPSRWRRRDLAGGRVEFDQLADGSWVVRRWVIRMPTRMGYKETGAEILGIDEARS